MARFNFAFRDQRKHGVADDLFTHLAEVLFKAVERNHGFGHSAMAAGAADFVEKTLHDISGALDIANVAHRDDDTVVAQTGDDAPLHAFDLQAKLRHLGNDIFSFDLSHVDDRDTVI